ncbi:MAG: DUF5682 family protein [Candidatus Heimdallarchaeota archaeon]
MTLQLESFDLDMDRIEMLVDEVMEEEIYYFPIRHHSPISALHVIEAIETFKPSIIFLELPYNLKDLIPYAIDKETVPPIAFYSAFKDTNNILGANGILSPAPDVPAKFQAWYPVVEYSPEFQVIKKAAAKHIKVIFFDLPFIHQAEFLINDLAAKAVAKSRNRDFLLLNNEFFTEFTLSSGYRTFNETWDSLFEIQGLYQDTEEYRRNFLMLAAASRSTVPQELLKADGTLIREGFMKFVIESKLKEKKIKASKAMVVCGAAHAVVLPQTPAKDVPAKGSAKMAALDSLIPFSYFGVSEFSGYGAGNRAPLYYEKIWKQLNKGKTEPYRQLALSIISRAMSAVRQKGEMLSTADIIAGFQSAILLASLRKRRQPNIDDIRDALLTVCVKGDLDIEGKNILEGLDKYLLGTRVGKVTRKMGHFPLSIDFYALIDFFQLPRKQQSSQLEISLKDMKQVDKALSAFLHKTEFLEVPYALCRQSQDLTKTTEVFTERWEICWSPQVDAKLLELSLHGTTVDAVVKVVLLENIETEKAHPNRIVPLLFAILNMRTYSHLISVLEAIRESIEESSSFIDLGEAFCQLVMCLQYYKLRAISVQDIDELVVDCFKRACFLLPTIAGEDDTQIQTIVSLLYGLLENALTYSGKLDFDLLTQMAQATIIQSPNHAIRGALTGILSKVRAISRTEITRQIRDYAGSQENEQSLVGDFLFGLLSVSQNLATDDVIFEAISHVVKAPDPPSFVKLLPGLKKCFADISPLERNVIIGKVKALTSKPKKSLRIKKKFVVNVAFLQFLEEKTFQIMEEWKI